MGAGRSATSGDEFGVLGSGRGWPGLVLRMTTVARTAAARTPIALTVKVTDMEAVKAALAAWTRPASPCAADSVPAIEPGPGGGPRRQVPGEAAGQQRAEDRDAERGPACWMVSFRAEPTPARSAGMVLISAPTAAGMATPAPRPSRPSATAGTANAVVGRDRGEQPERGGHHEHPGQHGDAGSELDRELGPRHVAAIAATARGMKARPALTGE